MLTGSSAITAQENATIQTPKLRVQMDTGRYFQEVRHVSAFAGLTIYQLLGVQEFNNQLLVFYIASDTILNRAAAITTDGISLISDVALSTVARQVNLKMSTYNTGNTLVLFVAAGLTVVNGTEVQRLATNDGNTWGLSEVIYNGTSEIANIYALGTSTVALSFGRSAASQGFRQLWFLRNIGSWGATDSGYNYMSGQDNITNIRPNADIYTFTSGYEYNNVQSFIIDSDAEDANGFLYPQLRVLTTDGLNIYGDNEIIGPTGTGSGSAKFSVSVLQSSKGQSFFYAWAVEHQPNAISNGISLADKTYLFKSSNLQDWTVGLPLPNDFSAGTTATPRVFWAGISSPYECAWLSETIVGSSYIMYNITKGGSLLDLTSDIITYQNDNNSRISLTIGNAR